MIIVKLYFIAIIAIFRCLITYGCITSQSFQDLKPETNWDIYDIEPCVIRISPAYHGWWCSGILFGLLRRRSGVQIPDPPTLEKCAKGICLCNLLRSTQPNDRETVIEG